MDRKKVSIDEMVSDINRSNGMFTDNTIYDNRKRVIPMTDYDKFKPILYNNLFVPSYVHGFSLAIEYMKEWFLKYLPDINFRYIHINGKHMFDDYKRFNNQNIKREKPCLIITPNVDYEYNRDNRDLYQAPADIFLRRSDWQRSFFKDNDNKLYLAMQMQGLRMQFNFRVKVSTRAEQLDLKEKMNLRFRIGATQGEYRSADFVVPMELLVNVAHDAGFKIKEFEQCTSSSVYGEGLEYFVINTSSINVGINNLSCIYTIKDLSNFPTETYGNEINTISYADNGQDNRAYRESIVRFRDNKDEEDTTYIMYIRSKNINKNIIFRKKLSE